MVAEQCKTPGGKNRKRPAAISTMAIEKPAGDKLRLACLKKDVYVIDVMTQLANEWADKVLQEK